MLLLKKYPIEGFIIDTEFYKISAVKQIKGNFEAMCYLSPTVITEMKWLKDNIFQVYGELKSISKLTALYIVMHAPQVGMHMINIIL